MARDAKGHGSNGTWDEDRQEKCCTAIRQGATLETAAAYAGIPRRTFHDWLQRGRQPKARDPYKGFALAVEDALAHFEVSAVAQIAKAGAEEWQASAWRLERRFPDKYGRRTRVDGNIQVTSMPVLDISRYTVEQLEQLRALLAIGVPRPDELGSDQRPALELLEGGGGVDG